MGASKVVYTILVLMQQLVVAISTSTCCSTSLTRKNQLSNKFQPVLLMTHYCFPDITALQVQLPASIESSGLAYPVPLHYACPIQPQSASYM